MYTLSHFSSPTAGDSHNNSYPAFSIPRRELHDVKHQVMSEDDLEGAREDVLLQQLQPNSENDLEAGKYEGGLKTWECANDLVELLAERYDGEGKSIGTGVELPVRALELGCGSALPSCFLLQLAFAPNKAQHNNQTPSHPGFTLIVADYNYDVLRLVTIPNLLLSWAIYHATVETTGHGSKASLEGTTDSIRDSKVEDVLEVTPELLNQFISDLEQRNISIHAISGGWGEGFVRILPEQTVDLVLASETIYQTSTLRDFTGVVIRSLGGDRKGVALVAAKRVYFGVGGTLEDFRRELERQGGDSEEVWATKQGVQRAILSVKYGAAS
jgi:protein-histidine N-methyltransferase